MSPHDAGNPRPALLKRILPLNMKRFWLIAAAFVVAALLHNLLSALLGYEEPVFFIVAIILVPLYLLISIVYTVVMGAR